MILLNDIQRIIDNSVSTKHMPDYTHGITHKRFAIF
jgi:hypothetical protein